MTATHSNLFRTAALKLTSLHSEDREWVLANLDENLKSELRLLLAELDQLGLEVRPEDFRHIEANVSETIDAKFSEADIYDQKSIDLIFTASFQEIEASMRNEPSIFYQYLTLINIWPWSESVRQKQAEFRLNQELFNIAPTVAARRAFIRAVANQIRSTNGVTKPLINTSQFIYRPSELSRPPIKNLLNKLFSWKR